METLTELFESRVDAFLERTGVKPTTLGRQAVGDPNLVRQLRLGRSPRLATADQILAFMEGFYRGHKTKPVWIIQRRRLRSLSLARATMFRAISPESSYARYRLSICKAQPPYRRRLTHARLAW